MIEAISCAKVNFSLRIGPVQADGLHRVGGHFQSIDWADRLTFEWGDEDSLVALDGGPVIAGWDNLVWKAAALIRAEVGSQRPLRIGLGKSIPAAAGLGGGSGNGAAALATLGRMCGVAVTMELAAKLGSDVPFCLRGGSVEVSGTGETLDPRNMPSGFSLGLVVPPIELSTAAVFRQWDEMGGPSGTPVAASDLPPALRGDDHIVNDLYPAAAAVAPLLEEWRHELERRWGRPALLTGSGPTLFGFFVDDAEATAALDAIPPGARATAVAEPVPFGWVGRDGSTMWSFAELDDATRELANRLFDG